MTSYTPAMHGEDNVVIRISGVSVRYRLAREKSWTLQEYLIQRLKGRKMVYEDFWALKNIHIDLKQNEILGIIGNNGAGKSTLLKVMAGVINPTEGEVDVRGNIAPLIELGAGFDMELTGLENIYLNASILGLSRKEIAGKVEGILAFSELGDFIHSPLKSYSSGMVARLGFSIATEVNPDILLIDEILSVGDEHFKKKCDERMSDFRERGVAIILVSHNMSDIRAMCNKVLWLDHGVPKMYGEPDQVVEAYHVFGEM